MPERLALACLVLVLAGPVSAGSLEEREKGDYGTTYWGRFQNAPFPVPGSEYKDNTIAVFVPRHFCPVLMRVSQKSGKGRRTARFECYDSSRFDALRKTKGTRVERVTRVDYVVHFHGHSNTVAKALNNHKLREQFSLSLQNAILVVPQGPVNAIDSAAGKLESKGGFARMMNEVHAFLQKQGVVGRKQRIGRIVVTSHSGGYRAAAMSITLGGIEVSEVFLFDSLYSHTDKFFEWISKGGKKGRRFVSVFFREKPVERNKELMQMLKKAGVRYASLKESEMSKPDFQRKRLARENVIFIHTDQGHSECTRGNFNYRDYLFASRLRRVRSTDWFQKTGLDKLKVH
jgi:hypothetical protein